MTEHVQSSPFRTSGAQQRVSQPQQRASEQRLARVPDVDWTLDLRTDALSMSDTLMVSFGWPSEDATTRQWWMERLHPDDRERMLSETAAVMDGADARSGVSYRFRDGHGEYVRVLDRWAIERDAAGRATRIVGTLVNLTARHAADLTETRLLVMESAARANAEAANRAKAEFLAAMSHELRTPLNAIAGYSELLEMEVHGPLSPMQREDVKRIQNASAHLLALISDILDFTRIEASRVELRVRDMPIDAVLTPAMVMVEPQADAKGVSASYLGCDPKRTARADPERVRQIVLNLLSNAIKFTRSGGCVVLACDGGSDPVRITVSDTGRGIPPDKLEAIFEPFVQVGRALGMGEHGGVGLGLAISRELARRMEGDLTVQSVHGEGSTFTLTLPAGPLHD